MNKNIKKLAKRFIKKYKLTSVSYDVLKNITTNIGYTIIEYNSVFNEKDIETVIKNLNLTENIRNSRGFTYVSTEYRLIFINENLNDEEKMMILSHELGHIVCEHFKASNVIGNDVKEEYEANEFSHYLLEQHAFRKIKQYILVHRKAFVALVVLLFLIVGSTTTYFVIKNKNIYKEEFYVTSTGKCYHKKDCIFVKNKTNVKRLTKEKYEKGIYEPCNMCIPDKE